MIPVRRGGPARTFLGGLACLAAFTLPAVATPQGAQEAVTILLLERTPWVGEGTDFVLTASVDGAPAGAQVRLTVHDRVRSRSEFVRTLEGQGLRTARFRSADVPLAGIDPEADSVVTVGVPLVAREGVSTANLTQPGVYPVVFEVLDGNGEAAAVLRTYLVRLAPFDAGSEAVALDVVVVLPVHAPPAHLTAGPPVAPDVPLGDLAGALGAHPAVAVTVVPTPETVDAAAVTDPASTAAFAAVTGDRQVLAGPWVVLDEAAWAEADPAELDRQLDRGRLALVATLEADPDGLRLAAPGTTSAGLEAMADRGASGFVVAGTDLDALDAGDFPFTLARPFALDLDGAPGGETRPALGSDPGLVALATRAETDPVLAAGDVLADLAVLAADQPALRRVATLVLPPAASTSAAFIDALLEGLEPPDAPPVGPPVLTDPADPTTAAVTPEPIPAAAPIVTSRTAAAALAEVEPAGADGEPDPDDPLVRFLPDEPPPEDISSQAALLERGRSELSSYRSAFGADDPLYADLDRLVATSAAAELSGAERANAMDQEHAAIDAALAQLHGPETQRVTLTARDGRIQLLLTNDSGRPANVTLLLRGDRLVLPDAPDGRLPVALVEQTTRVDLRVEARSSGDAPLDVVTVTPDERVEISRARVTVRTTAVSGVGVLLLGASAAFLVVWWTRTIVRERRHSRRRHPAHARRRHGDTDPTRT